MNNKEIVGRLVNVRCAIDNPCNLVITLEPLMNEDPYAASTHMQDLRKFGGKIITMIVKVKEQ